MVVLLKMHLLPSRGLDNTTPTAIQSDTPGTHRMVAITVRRICHHFTWSTRVKQYVLLLVVNKNAM